MPPASTLAPCSLLSSILQTWSFLAFTPNLQKNRCIPVWNLSRKFWRRHVGRAGQSLHWAIILWCAVFQHAGTASPMRNTVKSYLYMSIWKNSIHRFSSTASLWSWQPTSTPISEHIHSFLAIGADHECKVHTCSTRSTLYRWWKEWLGLITGSMSIFM